MRGAVNAVMGGYHNWSMTCQSFYSNLRDQIIMYGRLDAGEQAQFRSSFGNVAGAFARSLNDGQRIWVAEQARLAELARLARERANQPRPLTGADFRAIDTVNWDSIHAAWAMPRPGQSGAQIIAAPARQQTLGSIARAYGSGFAGFFTDIRDGFVGIVNDPVGFAVSYVTDPWNWFPSPIFRMGRDQVTTSIGLWSNLVQGDFEGMAEVGGQRAAVAATMLVTNYAGKALQSATAPPKVTTTNSFPQNPRDILQDVPSHTTPTGNIKWEPNQFTRVQHHPGHTLQPGETFNFRHHGAHYHVEFRIDPTRGWNAQGNMTTITPPGWTTGSGTGFLPGELFPGL